MMKHILYLGLDPTHCKADGKITHFPIIQIHLISSSQNRIKKALKSFGDYTHILITSKTTVKILLDYLPIFGWQLSDWKSKKTISVGSATTQQLQLNGIEPMITAKEETAEGLLQEIEKIINPKDFYFWPHSNQARSIIPKYFAKKNCGFNHCSIYQTLSIPITTTSPDLNHFDEIIFTSPSTVKAFIEIYGSFPNDKKLTPIGPVTAKFLESERVKQRTTSGG